MQFNKLSSFVIASAVLSGFAQTLFNQQLFGEQLFDNEHGTFDQTSCPGLGSIYPTFGYVGTYPFIGQTFFIPSGPVDHPLCGSYWQLSHVDSAGHTNTTFYTAVGSLPNPRGWNMGYNAVRDFAGLERNQLPGTIEVVRVDPINCNRRN